MRARGEGTIVDDPTTGRFVVKVPIDRYLNGRTRYKTRLATTKTEAEAIRRKLLADRESGRLLAGRPDTLRSYAEWYFANEAPTRCRPTTIYKAAKILDLHVLPALGHRHLVDLKSSEITELLTRLRTSYSAATVNNIRANLSGVLSSAVRNERLALNPVARTPKARREPYEPTQVRPAYSREEAACLIEAAKGSNLDAFIHLLVFTGMRRGEVLGLKWEDIDFTHGSLFISRTLVEGSRRSPHGGGLCEPRFNEPKTSSSRRLVQLVPSVLDSLTRHRTLQEVERAHRAADWHENGLVFTGPDGGAVWASNYWAKYRRFLTNHGLRYVRIHDLRHSFAEISLDNGVPLECITDTLGHSSIQVTKDIYGRSVPSLTVRATTAMSELLDPGRPVSSDVVATRWRAAPARHLEGQDV